MTELWMWEMQPGEKFASPGHTEGTLELFYVQSGTLTLDVQEHVYRVNTGCSATARTDVPHFYENQGENTLVFIMTVHEKAS